MFYLLIERNSRNTGAETDQSVQMSIAYDKVLRAKNGGTWSF